MKWMTGMGKKGMEGMNSLNGNYSLGTTKKREMSCQ